MRFEGYKTVPSSRGIIPMPFLLSAWGSVIPQNSRSETIKGKRANGKLANQ